MAGEIQVNSVTALTESGSNIVLNNVDTATNRTNLGLGSMATQDATAVALTGGSITGTEFDLKSTGTSVYKSDGSTAVISESSGTVTVNNATLGSSVVFPTGIIRQATQNSFNDQPTRGSTTFGSFSGTPSPVKHTINNCLTGSSLLIIVSLDVSVSTTGGSHTYFRLYDNTNATIVNSANEGTDGLFGTYLWSSSQSSHLMVNHTELYTPASFSSGSCEIEIYCKGGDASTVYLNTRASGSYGRLSSSITILEIAG